MELTLTSPGIAAENYWFRRHEVAYLAARPWVRGATVLDTGAGEGYGANVLSRVARRVITVDDDAAACEHAAKAYPALLVTRATSTALPLLPGTVDAVVCLRRRDEPPAAVAEYARVLRPAGVLVLSAANGPDRARELTGLLEPRFRVDRLYGVHHRGRLRRLDRRYADGIVAAQFASPSATWHPSLRKEVAAVTHRDFTFREHDVESALDLFVVATRR